MGPALVADLPRRRLSDDETVLIAPTNTAIVINEVGAVVLDLLDGSRTIEDIVRILVETLQGAERSTVERDVRAFVGQLSASGCIVDAP